MSGWLWPKSNVNTTPPANGLRVQTSMQGVARTIVWGQTRVAPNLIDYLDFQSHTQNAGGGGGGKGSTSGGGKGQSSTTTTYSVTPVMALCEGPINSVTAFWNNKAFNTGIDNFTVFLGTYVQTGWGYLTSNHPGRDLNYRGLAYVAQANVNLGNNPEIPQYNFEVISGIAGAYVGTGINNLPDYVTTVYNASGYPILNQGSAQQTSTAHVNDANPRDVIVDFLTNTHYGVGWPASRLDTVMNDYSTACLALGLVISPALTEAKDASAFLQEIADATNAGFRWTNGQLSIVPWFDQAITSGAQSNTTLSTTIPSTVGASGQPTVQASQGFFSGNSSVVSGPNTFTQQRFSLFGTTLGNQQYYVSPSGNYTFSTSNAGASININHTVAAQVSYQPYNTPIYDISDFLPNKGSGGDQPIQVKRVPSYYQYNSIKLEWLDRNNNYDPSIVEVKDQAAIEAHILRARDVKQTHMFCLQSAATTSATLQLQREKIPNVYTFTVGPEFILLDVEDIVTLTRPVMGLNQQPVRITEIQENDGDTLTITAEEYMGTVSSPLYSTTFATGTVNNYNVDPGVINDPWIFEPPSALTNGGLEIWGAVSGVNKTVWGGCHVWASYDGVNFMTIGTIIGGARMGVTTADLPTVTRNPAANSLTIDTVNTLAVDLTETNAQLLSGAAVDMTTFNTKCWVGAGPGLAMPGEIVAYQTAVLTAPGKYNLTTLNRGGYTSNIIDHPSGSPFTRMDNGIFALSYNQERIGQTVFFKFQSFNIYGGGLKDLSAIGMEAYVIQGPSVTSPLPNPTNLRVMFTAGVTQLWWDEVSDFRNPIYEIRKGPSWNSALRLNRQAHPPFVTEGDDTYWVSAFTIINNTLVYSVTPPSLVVSSSILAKNVFSVNEQTVGWTGTLTNLTKAGVDPNATLQLNQASFSGTYEISSTSVINIGYVANNLVGAVFSAIGTPVGQNILASSDILSNQDILGAANTANINAYLEIAVSQTSSTAFGSYQKFNAGVYPGRRYKFRATIENNDIVNTSGFITGLRYSVDVPTRLDHYTNIAVSSLGSTITFRPDNQSTAPFNFGINQSTLPTVNFSNMGLSAGDVVTFTSLDLTKVVVEVTNGSTTQARTLTLTAEGY